MWEEDKVVLPDPHRELSKLIASSEANDKVRDVLRLAWA